MERSKQNLQAQRQNLIPTVGFEAEFIHMNGDVHEASSRFQSFTGEEATFLTLFDQDPCYDRWYICEDSTINEVIGHGVELISPPLHLLQFTHELNTVLRFIRENGITDESCGLHFSVSMPGITEIDPLKLVFAVDEDKICRIFDRNNTEYAVKQRDFLGTNLRMNKFYHESDYATFRQHAEADLLYHKRATINLMTLPKRGYIEFRLLGGPHYEHRADLVFEAITECVSAVQDVLLGTRDEELEANIKNFWRKHVNNPHPTCQRWWKPKLPLYEDVIQ